MMYMENKEEFWVAINDYPVVRCESLDEALSKRSELIDLRPDDAFQVYKLTLNRVENG